MASTWQQGMTSSTADWTDLLINVYLKKLVIGCEVDEGSWPTYVNALYVHVQ